MVVGSAGRQFLPYAAIYALAPVLGAQELCLKAIQLTDPEPPKQLDSSPPAEGGLAVEDGKGEEDATPAVPVEVAPTETAPAAEENIGEEDTVPPASAGEAAATEVAPAAEDGKGEAGAATVEAVPTEAAHSIEGSNLFCPY